jgi:hypothetical protein
MTSGPIMPLKKSGKKLTQQDKNPLIDLIVQSTMILLLIKL